MDLWSVTLDARRSVLATFEQLDDAQWATPSLCTGWKMRELLAHLVLATRPPARRYVAAIARARGDFDRANQRLAIDDAAAKPIEELLSAYRSALEHRFAPPGWPAAAPLSDVLLHDMDLRIPLGLPSERPPEHFVPVAHHLFSRAGRSFSRPGRPSIRWIATDHAWTHGVGPEVRGSIADISLTVAGRAARVHELTGDGVSDVRSWLG